jgi:hypothetical protein
MNQCCSHQPRAASLESRRTMNFKTTYALIIGVLVVVGVFFWSVWHGPTPASSNYVLPSLHDKANPLDANDIDRVEIQRGETTLVFEKENNRWRITSPREYAGNSLAINELVRQIHDATKDKDAEKLTDPSKYGLAPPNAVIALQKGDRKVELNVGEVSPGPPTGENTVIYVTSSDLPNEIMAVKRRNLDSVLKTLNDFRGHDLLGPSSGDIQAFTLTELNKLEDKKKVTLGPVELKKGSDDRWKYVKPEYGDAQSSGTDAPDKPFSNVQAVLTDLSNLKVDGEKGFVADDVKDLAKYHLDPAKDLILRIDIDRVEDINKDSEGNREKKTKNVALVVGVGKKEDDGYYAYLDDAKHKDVVKISAKGVERLLQLVEKPDLLRDRDLVALRGQPDAIDVKNSWGTLEFRRTSNVQKPWKLWLDGKSYAVDEPTIQALISALTAPNQVQSFPDSSMKNQLGLDKPVATVTIWANSLPAEDKKKDDKKKDEKKEKKPEPKGKPAFVLSFGDLNQNSAAVERRRGDEKNGILVLVPARLRDQVKESPLAYFDKLLPPFNDGPFAAAATNVTKLTLTRDGETYEMIREDKAGAPWKIVKPKALADRTADRAAIEEILRDLNNLRAVKIVEDKIPKDAKLAEWGLKSPRMKAVVTVTKDGKAKTYEFDFGKEADDKSGIYVRTSLQDTISIVPSLVLEALRHELQDPTVFQFDVAKVKAIKMTGWIALQKQLGSDQPYVLQVKRAKNGSDWEVEKPSSFKLDPAKLNDFLRKLSTLQALKFVAHNSKPEAAQELDVAKGALKIEITLDGEKTPLELTVGKQDGEIGLFAITNKLPGDILDVRRDFFEGPKKEPVYFSLKN